MKLTDWRGNEYGPGDHVIYGRTSGRSIELQEGVVEDIYRVYDDPVSDAGWKRLGDGDEPPHHRRWDRSVAAYVEVMDQRVETQLRVRVQPTGRGSRDFHRTDKVYSWPDGYGHDAVVTAIRPKAVTIIVVENITKVVEG